MTDEQQPTPAEQTPPTPEGGPQPVETRAGSAPAVTPGVSRRTLFISTGAGVVAGAALGAGAVAFYDSQNKRNGTNQGDPNRRMPGGYGSGIPGGGRSGFPSGARPSGFPGGRGSGLPSGMPTDFPTDQPT